MKFHRKLILSMAVLGVAGTLSYSSPSQAEDSCLQSDHDGFDRDGSDRGGHGNDNDGRDNDDSKHNQGNGNQSCDKSCDSRDHFYDRDDWWGQDHNRFKLGVCVGQKLAEMGLILDQPSVPADHLIHEAFEAAMQACLHNAQQPSCGGGSGKPNPTPVPTAPPTPKPTAAPVSTPVPTPVPAPVATPVPTPIIFG